MKKQYIAALCALLCASCVATTGREFARPTEQSIALGTSNSAQIRTTYGEPYEQNTETVSREATAGAASPFDAAPMEGTVVLYTYFLRESQAPINGGGSTVKWVDFVFLNDKLYVYNYVSNFQSGSTQFDESKLAQLKKKKSTKQDVVSLLGEPGGRAIYPFVLLPGTEKYLYKYFEIEPASNKLKSKGVELLFDQHGILIDFRFASQSKALPNPAPAPAPVFIPMPVPAR